MKSVRVRSLVCAIWLLVLSSSYPLIFQTEAQEPVFRSHRFDSKDNLYIADINGHRVVRIDTNTGAVTIIAGNGPEGDGGGGLSGDGGPAASAFLNRPSDVTVDSSDNLLILDGVNSRIRRVDAATGIITTAAGGGLSFGDGIPASQARLTGNSIAMDFAGNIHLAAFIPGTSKSTVRRIDAQTDIITTVAGSNEFARAPDSVVGDGGPATKAFLYPAGDIDFDRDGNLFIADIFNQRIRRVDAQTGIITTVAGSGPIFGYGEHPVFGGDDGPATSARLAFPSSVALDSAGNFYIGDLVNNRVRRVDSRTGIITTIAGTGSDESDGDGGPAASASLVAPMVLGFDSKGNLYVRDFLNLYQPGLPGYSIRRIDARTGIITTVAIPFPDRETETVIKIFRAEYSRKILTIIGSLVGLSDSKVLINDRDVSRRIQSASSNIHRIALKGSRGKLNLRPGVNQIKVMRRNVVSNTLEFEL
jgi:hypothetical protein